MLNHIMTHTSNTSPNYKPIVSMIERCLEMQRQHEAASGFIGTGTEPPTGERLNFSSGNVYPVPSSNKSREGMMTGEAAEGIGRGGRRAVDSLDQYEVTSAMGRDHASKRRMNSRGGLEGRKHEEADGEAQPRGARATVEEVQDGDNPYFFIDTQPTPVWGIKLPIHVRRPATMTEAKIGNHSKGKKRKTSERSPQDVIQKSKKIKTRSASRVDVESTEAMPTVEFEDISLEVDARVKAKVEQRKAKDADKKPKAQRTKKQYKRRRSSDGDDGKTQGDQQMEKPKKSKKRKKSQEVPYTNGAQVNGDEAGQQ